MKLTFIGTGSAFNHKCGNNSAFLETKNNNLLLDCGYDVPINFEKFASIDRIRNIWISHMHADHIGGLEEIAFKNKFIYNKKCNLIVAAEMHDDLIDFLLKTLKWTNEGTCKIDNYFNVFTIKNMFSLDGEVFNLLKTHHIGNMPAYSLLHKKFIFSADTTNSDWNEYNDDELKYIFQDTQLKAFGNDVHATLDEIIKNKIINKTVCMHYGQEIDEFEDKIKKNELKIAKQFYSFLI